MGLVSGKKERLAMMAGVENQAQITAQAEALRKEGEAKGIAALGQGYDAARGSYGDASALYQPYVDMGQNALGVYNGSLGNGGQAGYDAAVNAFHTSPGFQKRQDLALDGVARKASATGALGSGNTLQALTDRSFDLGNAEFGNWQGQQLGLGQLGYSATGAQAGLTRGIGDLSAQQGVNEAGIYTGSSQAGMNNLNNAGAAYTNAMNGYINHADDASKNAWGLGMAGLNTAASLAGKFWGSSK